MDLRAPSAPHPGLAAVRAIRAPGVRPEPEALRSAYLELLKLCLCDLGGRTTTSVGRGEDGLVMSRELAGDQVRMRAAGMDWPLQGLTMTGLARLDDLQGCVESVIRDDIAGDLIETGVWRGGASILMRATLDSLGATDRTVYVADSFQGFPERDDELSVFDFLAVSVEEVRANFERFGYGDGVAFVEGFFADTLPTLAGRRWSIVRLDGDTYETTRLSLDCLYPGLSTGGYVIVDDFGALEECRKAVDDFRQEHEISEPIEEVDWTCVRWQRKSGAPVEIAAPPQAPPVRRSEAASREHVRVPSIDELRLQRELDSLRERLVEAHAELETLRNTPAVRAQAWLHDQLKRRRGR